MTSFNYTSLSATFTFHPKPLIIFLVSFAVIFTIYTVINSIIDSRKLKIISSAMAKGDYSEVIRHADKLYGKYSRYKKRVKACSERYKYIILDDIIREPAPSFYLDVETFRGIVYKTLRTA